MTVFGKRGQEGAQRFQAARPLASSAGAPLQKQASPHVIYREGETERPTFHGSHIEVHWPKYGAAIAVLLALGYLIYDGKRDVFGLMLAPVLFGAFSYLAMNGLRKSLNNVHTLRTQLFRSPAFLIGSAIGLCYFVYSTFISPQMVMGAEWGVQTAFKDGFQQQDFSAVAVLLLKGAGYMVGGGIIVEFIARKLLGANDAGGQK
ncbi:hypothetical protein [Allomesorhizobium camelthorni]|uniref:DUF4199 domain-containing protein n=1 Tax=Allomesorhizobium camelthorni TaxID=475069 RepID=A0A6G4W866_9HYPH|nr:hypothetical protein [Mesorhizobium camelthorni]NGO50518.1 hypothetical protein [Mesorhizobium camelthorni]